MIDDENKREEQERQYTRIEDLEAKAAGAQELLISSTTKSKGLNSTPATVFTKQMGDPPPPPPPPDPHPQARKPKALRAPASPSPKEVDQCVLTHMPYADWCQICRGCRRPNAPHSFEHEDD